MTHRIVLGALTTALLCACVTAPRSAKLTYESVPDGAQIFEGEKLLGTVPVTRTYESDGTSASITTPDVRAVWPSGAHTTYYTILSVGADRVATLERPADAPGLQQDLEHGKQVAAARKRDAQRQHDFQQGAVNEASVRCQQQQLQGTAGMTGDCRAP